MSRRAGFTLIEVMVAITMTAIVLGIAAGALSAATAARAAVERHQQTLEAESRMRSALTDMLRHAPLASAVDEPLVHISRDSRGDATLVFLSTGVVEPYGTGFPWRVTVFRSASDLVVDAVPIGRGSAEASLRSTLRSTLTIADPFDVRALEPARPGEAAQWRSDWPLAQTRPSALQMRLGSGVESTFVVALSPFEGAR